MMLRRHTVWIAVLLLGLFAAGMWRRARPSSAPAALSTPPPIHVRLAHGGELRLPEDSSQIVVLNFWAAWCPPCRAEAPVLSAAHASLSQAGRGRVVGLAVDTRSIPAAEELGMHYPVGFAPPDIVDSYGVAQLPMTFVLQGNMIRARFIGEVSEAALAEVLREI